MALFKEFWSDDKGFVWLLLVMTGTIVVTQFPIGGESGELLLLRFAFFLFTVIAIASSVLSPFSKRLGYSIAVLLLLSSIFLNEFKHATLLLLYGVLLVIYMSLIFFLVVKQIMTGKKMTVQKILGGVAAYILIGHLWTSLYVIVHQLNPNAFQTSGDVIIQGNSVEQLSYFSFVTLTTIGYGDITAVAPVARTLVILEGLLGQLFPAIFIAKLVSTQIESPEKSGKPGTDS